MLQASGKQEQLQSSPDLGPAFYTLYSTSLLSLLTNSGARGRARARMEGKGWDGPVTEDRTTKLYERRATSEQVGPKTNTEYVVPIV